MPRSVKVLFGQTLRSCELANPSYSELVARIVKMYPSLVGTSFTIRYQDEDDDSICLSSDAEMTEALKCTDTFRIALPKEGKDATTDDEWQHVADDTSSQPARPNDKTPNVRERPPASFPAVNVETKQATAREEKKTEPQYEHRGVRCDVCNVHPIVGSRYTCTVCPDFDICGSCEAECAHDRSHSLMLFKNPKPASQLQQHERVKCDECGVAPIAGVRFKCMVCPDFDLCSACEAEHPHPANHPLVKLQVDLKTLPEHLVKAISTGDSLADEKKGVASPVSIHLSSAKTPSPRPHFVRKGGCFVAVAEKHQEQPKELPKKQAVSLPEPASDPSLRFYAANLGRWVTAVRK